MFGSGLPGDRRERWALLGRFLGRWFPESRGNDGVRGSELVRAEQRLGLTLPTAFCEWYARYGARRDVWSLQDTLSMPDELRVERDVLIFCVENQAVVHWGIRLDDVAADDPPVVVSDPRRGNAWLVESPTTSAFAAQLAMMNVKWSRAVRYGANGQGTGDAFTAIDQRYRRLPFSEMHWPAWPTRFYEGDDIIIETNGDTWIWASARSRSALTQLDALVRAAGMDAWESYED